MLEQREPNKRCVERVARDLLVHDVVLPYHPHEVRLRSETVQQRPSASAERLLQVSQEDLPATVNSEDDALNRIHALYTTFEHVGVLAFSKSQVLSRKHVGGALDFIQALEMKRQETPGLHFIVQADSRIPKKAHKSMTEDRHLFPIFAVALHAGNLLNRKAAQLDAPSTRRMEAVLRSMAAGVSRARTRRSRTSRMNSTR